MVISTLLTEVEYKLILDIRELQYGELYDVDVPDGGRPTIRLELDSETKCLIEAIREGCRFFSVIQVHQSVPHYALVPGETVHGRRRCKRRLKFV